MNRTVAILSRTVVTGSRVAKLSCSLAALLVFLLIGSNISAQNPQTAPPTQEQLAKRYNSLYQDPNQTRFSTEPNELLVVATKDVKPGTALDVSMGQGRNAVYLAGKGWDVTGFDIADEGMRVAREHAAAIGKNIKTVHATLEDFDYGKERWDLIYFIYTEASLADPNYVARIYAALKPGGLVVADRPYRSLTNPQPGWIEFPEDKVNALAKSFSGSFQIVFYEDTIGHADWQQTREDRLKTDMRLVRLVARKR